jgi:hypothetical protein
MVDSDCPISIHHSASGAAFRGAMQGVTGLLGIGGFWKGADDSQLNDLRDQIQKQKDDLDANLQTHKTQLTIDQQKFAHEQLQNMQDMEDFHDSVLQDEISKNTLLIQITMVVVIIIIIYLIIL